MRPAAARDQGMTAQIEHQQCNVNMGLTCALVPLAGLEPATCCLGDNCPYSVLCGSVGSSQVRLGGVSGQSGLVRFSCGLWNDRQNDHLSKR
jgi:hypothetical protein